MVCKENVISWFGNLSSYKRIDVMCTLLNMCLPFEIRYLGTCVEDLGKRDYNTLRDTEHRANNVSGLTELTNHDITDSHTRRKLALYMALLHSCNYTCALILYEVLSRFDQKEIDNFFNRTSTLTDNQTLEELLLIYTMALNHPAFNYEQKSKFGNIFLRLQEEEYRLNIPTTGPSDLNAIERVESDPKSCAIPPPAMQTYQVLPEYHSDMHLRGNAMMAGMPPGAMTLPPPGFCIPTPEQMQAMQQAGHQPQFVQLGFPSMGPIPPWTGQLMMAPNQLMYPSGEMIGPYSNSPIVSRQSSPVQSQSQSRSSSPTPQIQRKTNGPITQTPRTSSQVTQPSANTLTTSTSTSSSQTNITSSTASGVSMTNPGLPSISSNRGSHLPPLLPSRPLAPYNSRNSSEPAGLVPTVTTSTIMGPPASAKSQQAPPRLKPVLASDTSNKEMPNFKGSFQNEIRRLSEEDVSKVDMIPNGLNVKSQAIGMLLNPEKKVEGHNSVHTINDPTDNEITQLDGDNSNGKSAAIPEQATMNYHPPNYPPAASSNARRYQQQQQLEPGMHSAPSYPTPAHIYPSPTACYSCLTAVPMSGMQNRYSRHNTPVYCLAQLQSLRLDPAENKHCSQGSSSDSSGSRSPPETPPAIQWHENMNPPSSCEHVQTPAAAHPIQSAQQSTAALATSTDRPRPRKTHSTTNMSGSSSSSRQHKSTQMMNGVAATPTQPPTVQAPPPSSTNINFGPAAPAAPTAAVPSAAPVYVPHGQSHFSALRPSTGIYTSFTSAYAPRPAPPPSAYTTSMAFQPNGDMMYQQYPPQAAAGNPPPPPLPPPSTGNVVGSIPPPPALSLSTGGMGNVQSPSGQMQPQGFAQSPPVVFTMAPPPYTQRLSRTSPTPSQRQQQQQQQQQQRASSPPPKTSCYNCGSLAHLASDCKEQTMEDITRGVSYRLDYTMKQPSGMEHNQSSDK